MTPASRHTLRALLTASVRIGLLTMAVKVLGVGRDAATAARYGTGPDMDGFLVAFGLLQFAINVVPGNVPSALIPGLVHSAGRPSALGRAVLIRILLLGLGLAGLFALFAPALVAFGAPLARAGTGPGLEATFRTLLPLLPLFGVQWCLASLLQAQGRFLATSLAPGFTVGAVLLALALLPGPPQRVLAWGALLGAVLEVLWLGAALWKTGATLAGPPPPAGELRQFWSQFGSVILGSIFMNSTNLVDLIVGAQLGPGTVAALNYASRLPSGLITLAVTALGTAALPHFAAMVAQGEVEALRALMRRAGRLILLLGIPLALLLALASGPLTRLLFLRGAFGPEEAALVAPIQALYFLQLPFYTLGILHVRLISAFQRNGLLLVWTLIAAALNLGLDLLFARWMGPKGIALSTTCMYLGSCLYMSHWTRRLLREGRP